MPPSNTGRWFGALRWPVVSRARFEEVVADRDFYRAQFVRLTLPEPKKPAPPPKSDEDMVREVETALVRKAQEAEAVFVQRLVDDFVRQGVPRADAEREARRIRQETVSPVRMA